MRMSRFLAVTFLAVVGSGSLEASVSRLEPLTPLPESPRLYLQALAETYALPASVSKLNIGRERPSSFGYLPAVANVQGAFGSFFTTDLFIINPHPVRPLAS